MPAIKNLDINRWGLPVVFYGYANLRRVLSYGNQPSAYIGAKAALFSVVGSNPLLTSVTGSYPCKDGRQDEESKNRIFEGMFAFVLSAGLLTIGLWLAMFYTLQHGVRWLGIGRLIAVFGWLAIAFQDVVLIFSENISTAPRSMPQQRATALPKMSRFFRLGVIIMLKWLFGQKLHLPKKER